MERLRETLRYGDDDAKEKSTEIVHVVAVPYPAQGHIVPLMQLCSKLASEEGVMVTFVNTMHNHARMLQADLHNREAQCDDNFSDKQNINTNDLSTCNNTDTHSNNYNTSTNCNCTSNSNNCNNIYTNESNLSKFNSINGHLDDSCNVNHNIRLVGIPGGLPPELHSDPNYIVAAFEASEALSEPLDKLVEKLNLDGPPVSCIISDVLMSWTQECADKISVPRFAFWTSSAAVYHVIWHMYGLISKGIPTLKAANTIFENNNTEMVSCIPGLPPMDLNDLPIIVRSDPADFIYQFLTRQLKPMKRAAAVLLNTFYELEAHCLQALPATTSPVPIYTIGPLLPLQAANVDGELDGVLAQSKSGAECTADQSNGAESMQKYKHVGDKSHTGHKAESSDGKADGESSESVKSDVELVGENPRKAVAVSEKAQTVAGKALLAEEGSRKATGIFSEDESCLEWLDKRAPRSVLYISFGSIFAMSIEQFTELAEGLQASKQAFLWSIRPGFVQGTSNYIPALPPSFLADTHDRGMLVPWVPQLSVLVHPAIAGFLTHCGWNSTLESVSIGVPMLCWPDVGERRTNGRLAVSLWQAGLEFTYSLHKNVLLISREEVKRVILLLMDPGSPSASHLRSKAASLQMSARVALSPSGSSSQAWDLFLDHIKQPRCH